MRLIKIMLSIILASKSKVRKIILENNNLVCTVEKSNVDEEPIKNSLAADGATPEIISKNLAEIKANKISSKFLDKLVLGADSVLELNGKIISKPKNREEALNILKNLNGKTHQLISSVCFSKNGSMIWNYTDKAKLTMKEMSETDLKNYLSQITDEDLYSYNVYQIEGLGRNLFNKIEGNKDTIMGLPIKEIKEYLVHYK
tara:strand:+ start:14 stop:616 length:603 start_codon:yes stop_codon:yes gene_type:complete